MIKDSGERTEFGTGAVRDMHSGNGRMDLLPWEALVEVSKHCEEGALQYGERNCEKGIPIHSLIDSCLLYTSGGMSEELTPFLPLQKLNLQEHSHFPTGADAFKRPLNKFKPH